MMNNSLRLAIILIQIVTSMTGCDQDTNPTLDVETIESHCDGLDEDNDGRTDEGLLNQCFGCMVDASAPCLYSQVSIMSQSEAPTLPALFQYKIFPEASLRIEGHSCTVSRIELVAPPVTRAIVTQEIQTEPWWSTQAVHEVSKHGIVLDGETPIRARFIASDEEVEIEQLPALMPSASSQMLTDICVENFDLTALPESEIALDPSLQLFVGGSASIVAHEGERATSFFVLSGQPNSPTLDMYSIRDKLWFAPNAVQCAFTDEVQSLYSAQGPGFVLSSSASVSSSERFGDQPIVLDDIQSPRFLTNNLRLSVDLSPLTPFGAPSTLEVQKSLETPLGTETHKITCQLDPSQQGFEVDLAVYLPDMVLRAEGQAIFRLNWSEDIVPLSEHPLLLLRNNITIQTSRELGL